MTTAIFIVNHKINNIKSVEQIQKNNNYTAEDDIRKLNDKNEEYDYNNSKITLYPQYHQNIEDGVTGVSLEDTFYKNALLWKKHFYEDDEWAGYYYQIEGLKNKEVQDIVNQKLLNSALKYTKSSKESNVYIDKQRQLYRYDSYDNTFYTLDDYFYESPENTALNQDEKNYKKYFNQLILSSFSNVICVATSHFSGMKEGYFSNNYYQYRQFDEYLNIDLNTGNDLRYESIFTEDADLKSMLSHILYPEKVKEDVPWQGYDWEEDEEEEQEQETLDLADTINGPKMNEIEKIINKLDYTDEVEFAFTPSQFIIHIGDYFCIRDFYEDESDFNSSTFNKNNFYPYVAIFKRYLSNESLYENDKLSVKFKIKDYYKNDYDRVVMADEIDNGKQVLYYNYSRKIDDYKARELLEEYYKDISVLPSTVVLKDNTIRIKLYDIYFGKNYKNAEYLEMFNTERVIYGISYGTGYNDNNTSYVEIKNDKLVKIDNIMKAMFKNEKNIESKEFVDKLWKIYLKDRLLPNDLSYTSYKIEDDRIKFYYNEYSIYQNEWQDTFGYLVFFSDNRYNYNIYYPLDGIMNFT